MKTLFILVALTAPYLWGQDQPADTDPNHESMQVGMQTGLLFNQTEAIPVVQFTFATYSALHWGFYLEPTIGLEGWGGHQILGSIHYVISGGLQYTVAGRSAILGGYTWGGRYDGIQFRDPINRQYHGPWVGFRWNFPDGVWMPHGNFSLMGKMFFATVRDRTEQGWVAEYQQLYGMLTVAYNLDLF